LAGRPFVRMLLVVDNILYEVLPFLEEMGTSSGEILWCSYPDDVEG
jgi:hypothetical protein